MWVKVVIRELFKRRNPEANDAFEEVKYFDVYVDAPTMEHVIKDAQTLYPMTQHHVKRQNWIRSWNIVTMENCPIGFECPDQPIAAEFMPPAAPPPSEIAVNKKNTRNKKVDAATSNEINSAEAT